MTPNVNRESVCFSPFEKVPPGIGEEKTHFCVYPKAMEPRTVSYNYNILKEGKIFNCKIYCTIGYLYTIKSMSYPNGLNIFRWPRSFTEQPGQQGHKNRAPPPNTNPPAESYKAIRSVSLASHFPEAF